MYMHQTIKEAKAMAEEIKEQAKEFDYKGTAKQAGSVIEESLAEIGGFAIRVVKKAKKKAE